ncbi:MAG: thymidine phosphorylase [Myxococcales bacterium]|nr:thymidine phosphorylase [Myxococcales bacterium]
MHYRAAELIAAKRDGAALSKPAIDFLIRGYVDGSVPDYQMAAFAMATFFKGMTADETAWLLDAMQRSGDVLHWDDLDFPTADKHSTGGVGDKISLPLAPAVAACGVGVPMISGRGLGHTGGTLDKLESIPGPGRDGKGGGFDVRLSLEDFKAMVAELRVSLIGQTPNLCPADRKMYALRDVTATVESIPLIVASIMSKKLAEGAGSLVLDVKVGSGAFMRTVDQAQLLARAMVDAGQRCGRNVTAFLTAMDRPLGTHIGNALEVVETIELLRGGGPADSRAVTCRLGGEMLRLAGTVPDINAGEAAIAKSLDDGSALEKFRKIVQAHGGDPRVVDTPELILPQAPIVRPVLATGDGVVGAMDALQIGLISVRLGAGRNRKEDDIDPSVGLVFAAKPGDTVVKGQPLCWVHAGEEARAQRAIAELQAELSLLPAGQMPDQLPLFIDAIYKP